VFDEGLRNAPTSPAPADAGRVIAARVADADQDRLIGLAEAALGGVAGRYWRRTDADSRRRQGFV